MFLLLSDTYGVPPSMSFLEFQQTPHWEPAMAEVRKEAELARQKRAEAEAKRQETGWKKPGTKPKSP